jgi:hypothetical protein
VELAQLLLLEHYVTASRLLLVPGPTISLPHVTQLLPGKVENAQAANTELSL